MQWRRSLGGQAGTLDWWVAWLFMVGAFLFALGSFPPYSQLVDGRIVGVTFVVGSIFFTSAAAGQLVQTRPPGRRSPAALRRRRAARGHGPLQPQHDPGASDTYDIEETNRLVWGPDFFGSIAFLVASHLVWVVVCGGLWHVLRDDADWWVAALNYLGSIFFMASALASFTLTTTGSEINTTIVNSGTFLGALCFLLGAYLVLPVEPAATLNRRRR